MTNDQVMKINVKHIAQLANLPLRDGEEEKFEHQLSQILTHVQRLEKVNTDGVPETNQSTGLENVTREDKTETSLTQKEALSTAAKKHNDMFVVPAVLEEN